MNFRFPKLLGAVVTILLLSNCSITPRVVNLTPQLMPSNPSGIYTFSVKVDDLEGADEGAGANLVIGGEVFAMKKASGKQAVYTFDYAISSNQSRALYYFEIFNKAGNTIAYSDKFNLRLTNRYVVDMSSTRAQPGTTISILGRGFRDSDMIVLGGSPQETRFISERQLEFDVPAFEGGEDYPVGLQTSGGTIAIGKFRIDFSELRSVPGRLVLNEGQAFNVIFSIDRNAPPDGVNIDLSLSNPNLLEFEPIRIAAGERSVQLQVIAGEPGEGELIAKAPAHNRLILPVTVKSRVEE